MKLSERIRGFEIAQQAVRVDGWADEVAALENALQEIADGLPHGGYRAHAEKALSRASA